MYDLCMFLKKTSFDLTLLGLLKETSLAFSLVVTLKDKKRTGKDLLIMLASFRFVLSAPSCFLTKK